MGMFAADVHTASVAELREAGIRPTAQQLFAEMTPAEQDEAYGPAKAEALRRGRITFADLVGEREFDGADNFLREESLKRAEQ